jgi:hypothetical protein
MRKWPFDRFDSSSLCKSGRCQQDDFDPHLLRSLIREAGGRRPPRINQFHGLADRPKLNGCYRLGHCIFARPV